MEKKGRKIILEIQRNREGAPIRRGVEITTEWRKYIVHGRIPEWWVKEIGTERWYGTLICPKVVWEDEIEIWKMKGLGKDLLP